MSAEPFVAALLLAAIGLVLLVAGRLRPRRSPAAGPPPSILDLAGALALVGAFGLLAVMMAILSAPSVEVRPQVATATPVGTECPGEADVYAPTESTTADPYLPGALPAGFQVSGVVLCSWEATRSGETNQTVIEVVQHEGAVTDDLRAALALPDLFKESGVCTLEYVIPPFLMVTDGSRGVMVRLPEDECGKVRPEVMEVIDALDLRETRTFRAS